MKKKMTKKNFIQKAIPASRRGALHKELGVPLGEKIPAKKLKKAAKSKSPLMRKQVALAKTLKKLNPKKG